MLGLATFADEDDDDDDEEELMNDEARLRTVPIVTGAEAEAKLSETIGAGTFAAADEYEDDEDED